MPSLAGLLYTGDGPAFGGVVSFEGRITEIRPEAGRRAPLILPGLTDLHLHGFRGLAAEDGPEALAEMADALAAEGVTGFCPTLVPAEPKKLRETAEILGRMRGRIPGVLGLYLEGPFLNPEHAGILPAAGLRSPDPGETAEILAVAGRPLIMTVAPELPGSREVVQILRSGGAVPAAGHSVAGYETARRAFGWGIRHVTHLLNAQAYHHREPGLPGAALFRRDVTLEVIGDGRHLHPAVLTLLARLRGDGLILVSDATALTAVPDGEYRLWGRRVRVEGGRPELNGAPAGGSAVGAELLRRLLRQGFAGEEIVRWAAVNPARRLGLRDRGRLRPGFRADFTVWDPDFRLQEVWRAGRRIFIA